MYKSSSCSAIARVKRIINTEKAARILASQLPRYIVQSLHSTKSATSSLQCTITCLETVQLDFFSEFLACVFKVGERHLHRPEFYAPLDVVRVVGRSGRQLEANCSPVG